MNRTLSTETTNLSLAWAEAFLALMAHGCAEINPLIVTVTGIEKGVVQEIPKIRELLDKSLASRGTSCHTVANTIFPNSLWNPARPRQLLFDRYARHAWPRIKKCRANNRGTYFHRLMAFENGAVCINQLDHVIETWRKGNHRHSALQLAVFDPRHDHTDCRQMGFPCLHQVCFTPLGTNGQEGLAVTGFYATQYVFEKAYGNYLGLCRLGHFMAHEMGLRLVRMTCIAASGRLGHEKSALGPLAEDVRRVVNEIAISIAEKKLKG